MTGHDADTADTDRDVLIVGGGPAGCSAGVFTARYGLDTVILDRGRSSIQRCAHLENYLGFPAGIDIETFYELLHDHAETAGCDIVPDLVESVERCGTSGSFTVCTADGREVTATRVVAATRYDGEYLRPLCGDSLFETVEYDGEEHERFDRAAPANDGSISVDGATIDGLYVASPSEEADQQAIIAAGRGGRIARTLLRDVRRDRGYPEPIAPHYDWIRREEELEEQWRDRDHWRETLEERLEDEPDCQPERWEQLRERDIDRRLDSYLSPAERDQRATAGQRRLLAHLDDELLLDNLDLETILDYVDDERILEYAEAQKETNLSD